MWHYRTSSGVFWIRFSPQGRGTFLLGMDDEELGAYFSPEAAADDVFMQKTGWEPWDCSEQPDRPVSISEWQREDCSAWDARRPRPEGGS